MFMDGSGNKETATQVVTVKDAEKPKITAPADVTINADAGKCTASGVALGTPITSDNSSVATFTSDAVEPFTLGSTTVTWTVMNWFKDNCNGTSIGTGTSLTVESPAVTTIYYANWSTDCGDSECASITIMVFDTEIPHITAPADVHGRFGQ